MTAQNIYGVHDSNQDWAGIIRDFGMTGYAIVSEEIGDDPTNQSGVDYRWLAAYGVTPIVRLNYSHHGEGTIPLPGNFTAFATRCANFVTASNGCTHWLIGNEPNLRAERYGDVPITPASYANCFNKCRLQIKHRAVQHNVIPAAIAPYNADTGWCLDYWREMLSAIVMTDGGADGLALHTYSRGPNPSSITSEDKMDAPYQDCHNGFRAYQDFLALVPAIMRALPVYITETDQLSPWADTTSGWVEEAYMEIDRWNAGVGHQGIHCLALYRWENYDQWGFCRKNGVINDFRAALTLGFQAPTTPISPEPPTPTPPDPEPPRPTPAPPTSEPTRDIDPRLIARGVHFDFAKVPAGTGYWRIVKAFWLDEDEADAVGPDHHALGTLVRDGKEIADIPLRVDWPSGNTTVISKRDQPNASFNWDFPMSPSLNEYSVYVADGNPSDKASGIGMGTQGNSRSHTSTWLDFSWTISEGITVPPTPAPGGGLVHPLPGAVITQHFYQNPENYNQWGLAGHDGCDLGGRPQRTEIRCIADGVVAYSAFDAGYGFYCRVDHRDLECYSMYCHMDEAGAPVGRVLKAGDTVGLLGTTGNSSGVHLHIEIRKQNKDGTYSEDTPMPKGRVDPETWCCLHGLKL